MCTRCRTASDRTDGRATPVFPLADLPPELQSLVVEQMPLRTMARQALTNVVWAGKVQQALKLQRPWTRSYANHRCSHDLTCEARTLFAPEDTWGWIDHLHVLEVCPPCPMPNAQCVPFPLRPKQLSYWSKLHVFCQAIAVRQQPHEVASLVEAVVGTDWWLPKYFDEEAVARATSRCLLGRATAQTVLNLYRIFAVQRNPTYLVVHCTDTDEHHAECGGFCADNEMANRAWSLRALAKPLAVPDAAVVGPCLAHWKLSANNAAIFLLSYFGSVWEIWDFTPADAMRLAQLAAELDLACATVAALLCRLASEEEAFREDGSVAAAAAAAASPPFVCTLTLLLEWAQRVSFPGDFPPDERKHVLRALAMQSHRPGFTAAARPVFDVWAKILAATGLTCVPCAPRPITQPRAR